jgi:hypothetical protein
MLVRGMRQTGRWREETDGWGLHTGTSLPYSGGALLACSSAGGGGAGPGGAGEEDRMDIKRGSAGRISRPC